jgi:uncharacterized membrane protein
MADEKKAVDGRTTIGMTENVEALFSYVFGWITGLVFFILEKENKFVRFHAMQSILYSVALIIVNVVLGVIPVLGWAVLALVNIAGVVLWIILMVRAYQGEKYKLPILGDIAEKQVV